MNIRYSDARARAIRAGATVDELVAEEERQARQRPAIRKATAQALQMHSWHNTKDDWVRLAGALAAR
jgi:metal-responsive CopG/Arc/MetJ family transcriptional regulator